MLNNGIKIPSVGFGAWQTPDNETAVNTICTGVRYGYRQFDSEIADNDMAYINAMRFFGDPGLYPDEIKF